MDNFIYVTGNQAKYLTAKKYFEPLGVDVIQKKLNIPEIQSDKIEEVALDKAQKAFAILKHPLIVNDTSWLIEVLNGFPGPYTHYVANLFTSQDWLSLLKGHPNRKITLRHAIVFIDKDKHRIFTLNTLGVVLKSPKGNQRFSGFDQVVSLAPDRKSLAEIHEIQGYSIEGEEPLWHQLSNWLRKQ